MTRNEAYTELVARLDHDVNVEHQDYCVGESLTRDLFERFRRNDAVQMDLTAEQIAAVETTRKPQGVGGYYYECPTCSKVTPIRQDNDGFAFADAHRSCDHCGARGCGDCISLAALCPTCFENMMKGQAHVEGVCGEDSAQCRS